MLDLSSVAQQRLMWAMIERHPLPWTVEQDWTYEIYDSTKALVLKCMTSVEANELISFAERLMEDYIAAEGEIRDLLGEPGEDPSDV